MGKNLKVLLTFLVVACLLFPLVSENSTTYAVTQATNTEILDMCSRVVDYLSANGKIPAFVYTDAQQTDSVSAAEFYYMMVKWLRFYKNNNNPPSTVSIVRGIEGPANPSGQESGTIYLADILVKAELNADFIDANGRLSNYSTVGSTAYTTKAMFSVFARTLNWYQDNGFLPNYATVTAVTAPDSWTGSAPPQNTWAIWLRGGDARNYGCSTIANKCAANGITDIYLLVKGSDGSYRFDTLNDMINAAHPLGIKVHAWLIMLQDSTASGYSMSGPGWVNAKDTNYKNYIMNNIITPLTNYNIDGIQLDCLRYPGNAYQYTGAQEAITGYCSSIRTIMNNNGKSSIPVSVVIMPEGSSTAYYYGQNAASISPYLGFITPMTYTHNYGTQPSWVGAQVAYFVSECAPGCKVRAAIQTLDDEGDYMSTKEINACIQSAMDSGSAGVGCFRYPLSSQQWSAINTWTP